MLAWARPAMPRKPPRHLDVEVHNAGCNDSTLHIANNIPRSLSLEYTQTLFTSIDSWESLTSGLPCPKLWNTDIPDMGHITVDQYNETNIRHRIETNK